MGGTRGCRRRDRRAGRGRGRVELPESEFDGVPATFDGTWTGEAPVPEGTAALTLHLTRGATETRVHSEGDGGANASSET